MHLLHVPEFSWRRSKGFTLLEIIISIGLMSLIISIVFALINFVSLSSERVLGSDDTLLNGRHALDYILADANESISIMPIDSINNLDSKFENNMGFVLRKSIDANGEEGEGEGESKKYRYVFYTKSGDSLIRRTFDSPLYDPPTYNSNGGNNNLLNDVESISNCVYDEYNNVLVLSIIVKDKKTSKKYEFIETISINKDSF